MPKAQQVRDMTDEQLAEHVDNMRRELFGLRFQHATGELENTAGMRNVRRDLARALTVARDRNLDVEAQLRRAALVSES
jgi:large subunit ribosomal protein L29